MPVRNEPPRYTFEQFAAIHRYQPTLAFSPDGTHIAYVSDASGQFNLWRQATDGGEPVQLTAYDEHAVREVAWSPDGATLLFTRDHHGDEFHQLHLMPAAGGEASALTDQPQVQHYLAERAPWSPDSRRIVYAGNDRVTTDQDVLIRDLTTASMQRVLAGDAFYFPVAWSPDGASVSAIDAISTSDTSVYLISPGDGSARCLTPHEGEVQFLPGPWSADGSGFFLLSDEGREFIGLAFFDLRTGAFEWLETPAWDISTVDASQDGRILAWVVNEDGYSRLSVRDRSSGQLLDLPPIPEGVIEVLRVSPDGSMLGFLLNQPQHPAEVFILNLAAGELTQLTSSLMGGVSPADLIQPALVRFPTHDGREIPAYLYRPRGSGPFPVVLSIHGGPEAQELPEYASGLYQYWASRGIGVLAPNVRGSTGYGKTYQRLIHRDWGGDELKDFEAAARYLRSLDWVDAARLGVFGGSFGGVATLSCISRLPEYWAAAVDVFGPSNLVTAAKADPPTWRRLMAKWVGDPETEADFLLSRSPITYVDQIRAPLFVIQGANDPRVVQGESDQIVALLRQRGMDVRYDVYPDEGHAFTKRANELKSLGDAATFMEQHLLRSDTGTSS